MKKYHRLKIEPKYFQQVYLGNKKAEIRFNDRKYKVGDIIVFQQDRAVMEYLITHVHKGLGLEKGFVMLSIEKQSSTNH